MTKKIWNNEFTIYFQNQETYTNIHTETHWKRISTSLFKLDFIQQSRILWKIRFDIFTHQHFLWGISSRGAFKIKTNFINFQNIYFTVHDDTNILNKIHTWRLIWLWQSLNTILNSSYLSHFCCMIEHHLP